MQEYYENGNTCTLLYTDRPMFKTPDGTAFDALRWEKGSPAYKIYAVKSSELGILTNTVSEA
jgi:hypothetical protein